MWKFPPPQSLSLSSSHVYIPLLAMFFFLNFFFYVLFFCIFLLLFLLPFLQHQKSMAIKNIWCRFSIFAYFFVCSSTLFALYKICIAHIKKSKMKMKKKIKRKVENPQISFLFYIYFVPPRTHTHSLNMVLYKKQEKKAKYMFKHIFMSYYAVVIWY